MKILYLTKFSRRSEFKNSFSFYISLKAEFCDRWTIIVSAYLWLNDGFGGCVRRDF